MNSALAVLGAIAAILATIGYLLFGKPKGEDTRSGQAVERVQVKESVVDAINTTAPMNSTVDSTNPIVNPPVAELEILEPVAVESAVLEPGQSEVSSHPLPEQTYGEVGGITLDTVEQPDTVQADAIDPNQAYYYDSKPEVPIDPNQAYYYDSKPEVPIELNFDDATQANELIQETSIDRSVQAEVSTSASDLSAFAEPLTARRADPVPPMAIASSYSVNNPPIQLAPYSVLNDSKRPKSLESQKLSQQILTWGQSAEHASQIISYAQNQDPIIRKYVAQSLTLMVKKNPDRSALSTVISTLETLSHDSDQGVKSIARSGLGA
jgi:hypothetical protein